MKHRRRSTLKRKTRGKRHRKTHYRRKSVRRMKGGAREIIPFKIIIQDYLKQTAAFTKFDPTKWAPMKYYESSKTMQLDTSNKTPVGNDEDYELTFEGDSEPTQLAKWYAIPFTDQSPEANKWRKEQLNYYLTFSTYLHGYNKVFPPNSFSVGNGKGNWDGKNIYIEYQ
jgi:hypothetical protein